MGVFRRRAGRQTAGQGWILPGRRGNMAATGGGAIG